jgi:hypothetical protein
MIVQNAQLPSPGASIVQHLEVGLEGLEASLATLEREMRAWTPVSADHTPYTSQIGLNYAESAAARVPIAGTGTDEKKGVVVGLDRLEQYIDTLEAEVRACAQTPASSLAGDGEEIVQNFMYNSQSSAACVAPPSPGAEREREREKQRERERHKQDAAQQQHPQDPAETQLDSHDAPQVPGGTGRDTCVDVRFVS